MNFEVVDKTITALSSDAAIVFAFQGEDTKSKKPFAQPLAYVKELDKKLDGLIAETATLEKFSGKKGEVLTIFTQKKIVPLRILVVGLGKKETFTSNILREVIGKLAQRLNHKVNSVSLILPNENELQLSKSIAIQVVAEGFLLGSYEFSKYKSEKEDSATELELVTIAQVDAKGQKELKPVVQKAQIYAKATMLARDLVNEQAAQMTPTKLAELALSIAKKNLQIQCKIFDKVQAEKMGMDAFLGIARASETPPKFIFLEYVPKSGKSKEKIALVGKGITFDTGGINVKPEQHMTTMKEDMAGAAAVLAVFSVIAEVNPSVSVIGLVAATPNLISGNGIVPGDVVKALNGKTIEVLNTDAEGRVTLADSLSFAVKEKATKIIDLATLTGACMVALGLDYAGLFSNTQDLAKAVQTAGMDAGEKTWELPLPEEYKELNKSEVADISNLGSSRYGGAITAALFLQEFVGNTPWVHLDIAGPAFSEKGTDLSPKGGTGYGVRTLLNLLANL